jgi:hypothetical protein
MLPLLFAVLSALAPGPQRHTFVSGDRIITIEVEFVAPYQGTRLAFYTSEDHRNSQCWSGNGDAGHCPEHFVGSVATVHYTVKRAAGKLRGKTSIREYVTVRWRYTLDAIEILTVCG